MQDRELKLTPGVPVLVALALALGLFIALCVYAISNDYAWVIWILLPYAGLFIFACNGFIINGPNEARVVQLFGNYVGTVKDVGLFYGNPLYWRTKVSLRVRTFETGMSSTEEVKDAGGRVLQAASMQRQPLKVNDKDGTPIEIAAAMLQRQQAGAIIAARTRIVEGAVGMVEHALQMLSEKNIVELDSERKAAMVSNLLVVLCGHAVPQPVINAGTLHN